MITIVDVTGSYIFGFGNGSAIIGSMTRGISPIAPASLSATYPISNSVYFTTVTPVTIYNNDAVQKIYKYAGLITPNPFSIYTKFSLSNYFDKFTSPTPVKLSATYPISNSVHFTTVTPVKLSATYSISNSVYFTSINTPIIATTTDYYKFARLDVGAINYTPKIISVKFYLDTEQFKISFPIRSKLVSVIKYPYVFGDNPSMNIMRSNFYGMQLPYISSNLFLSYNAVNNTQISYLLPENVLSVKFYLNTEQFKTSFVIPGSLNYISDVRYRGIYNYGSFTTLSPIITADGGRYTTIYNYGSGIPSQFIANIKTNLTQDYLAVVNYGMKTPIISSAYMLPALQQTSVPVYTKVIIQFWS